MISNPVKRKSYNCYSGSVCYLLERKGAYLSEHVSFGLSAGLDFKLQFDEELSFRAVRELHCLTRFLDNLGVEVKECKKENFYSFLQDVKECIDKDMPVMADYDGFYFPFTQIFRREHEKRIALIVGYDQENLYVSDFIYGVYEVPISLEQFEQAVTLSKGSCVNPRWYDVYVPEKINEKITSSLVYDAIAEVFFYFTNENRLSTTNEIRLENVEVFSRRIQEFMSSNSTIKVDWCSFAEDMKQSVITFQHYGDFILDIATLGLLEITPINANEICDLFHAASASWRMVCNLIFKFGLTQKESLCIKIASELDRFKENLGKAFYLIKMEIL